jgi:hypothetical protein
MSRLFYTGGFYLLDRKFLKAQNKSRHHRQPYESGFYQHYSRNKQIPQVGGFFIPQIYLFFLLPFSFFFGECVTKNITSDP